MASRYHELLEVVPVVWTYPNTADRSGPAMFFPVIVIESFFGAIRVVYEAELGSG